MNCYNRKYVNIIFRRMKNNNCMNSNNIITRTLCSSSNNNVSFSNGNNYDVNVVEKVITSLKTNNVGQITIEECRNYLHQVDYEVAKFQSNDVIDGIFVCMNLLNKHIDTKILKRQTKQALTLTELCLIMKTLNKCNCDWKLLTIYERNIFSTISYKAIGKGFRSITSFTAYLYGLIAIKAEYKLLPNVISIPIINALAACPARAWKSSSSQLLIASSISTASPTTFKTHDLFKPICMAVLKLKVPEEDLPEELQVVIKEAGSINK